MPTTRTTKTQLLTCRLDYDAGLGVLGIAAATVIRNHNDRSRLFSHRSSSSSSSSNISSMTSKCLAKSATTVGIKIDDDAVHIANDNAHKNGTTCKITCLGSIRLDNEETSIVLRAINAKATWMD